MRLQDGSQYDVVKLAMLHLFNLEGSHWASHMHFETEFCMDCDWERVDLGQSDKARPQLQARPGQPANLHSALPARMPAAALARKQPYIPGLGTCWPAHRSACNPVGVHTIMRAALQTGAHRAPHSAGSSHSSGCAQTEITKVWGDQNKRWKLFITRFFNCEVCYGRMDKGGLAKCQQSFREHYEFASCRSHRYSLQAPPGMRLSL